jgi:hypothetical protein
MICVAFILFHAGETRALLPTMRQMAAQPEHYCLRIIPVGQVAKNNLSDVLMPHIIIPRFIQAGMGHNDAYHTVFSEEDVQEIVGYCDAFQHIIMGVPAKIQIQVAKAMPKTKQRIAYVDVGADECKIDAFSNTIDILIVTSLIAKKTAEKLIMRSGLKNKPRVLAGRHGDFDSWRERYEHDVKDRDLSMIQVQLGVASSDNVILWAGGYGDRTDNDIEKLGFTLFMKAFVNFKHQYQLRIAIHPGIKNYSSPTRDLILEAYYIRPLLEHGFSQAEIKSILTRLDTFSIACVAIGVVSVSSMVGPQAVSIGVRAKTVFVNNSISSITGIKTIKTAKAWQAVLSGWLCKKRRAFNSKKYHQAICKLSLPKESTWDILEDTLMQDDDKIRPG